MTKPFELMEGTAGIGEEDIAHLMIPGRERSADGMGLSLRSEARVATAASFYVAKALAEEDGFIVCSGYKTPADHAGEPWHDERGVEYEGVPEAYTMRYQLLKNPAIPEANIVPDIRSIDTVTNFTNVQELFLDKRPVGIVAQEQHLDRMLSIIAPRTMKRDYVGIVVPEIPEEPDTDGLPARLVSRYIARGLTPQRPDSVAIAEARATQVWNAVLVLSSLKERLGQRQAHNAPA